MLDRGSRHSKIMQIFQLENDFLKHRQKIIKTQRKDAVQTIKKSYNSQMDMINSFRKNWTNSNIFKHHQQQKQINHNNKLLHQSLLKQYHRESSVIESRSLLNKTAHSNSSSRVSLASNYNKKKLLINLQNSRIMKKITSVESSLDRKKFQTQYKKAKANRQKLEVMSTRNKQKLKNSLRKMNIQPTVYFPKMRQKFSTIK